MRNGKVSIAAIFFSPTGTSKKGAEAIAQILQNDAESIDMTLNKEYKKRSFSENDVIVFGAPVYSGRMFKGVKDRLAAIEGNNTPCIVTVTYGNRDYDDALLELSDMVKAKGFIPIAGAALIGEHTYGKIQVGRPDGEDIKEDRVFAQKIMAKLSAGDRSEVVFPGNIEYKNSEGSAGGKFRPLTNDNCTNCGLCAEQCPENAIDKGDYNQIDDDKCIACFRCIRICPVQAKHMETPEYMTFAAEFTKKLAQPRINEYFM